MFAFIQGEVIRINERRIIVIANSVGYEINVSSRLHAENGDKITLFTHLIHKEDLMSLYGFSSREEKNIFLTLISAQGVGPKLGMEILSSYSINDIIEILFTQNITKLKKVQGMGAKKAEKLLFDLKDKVEKIDIGSASIDLKDEALSDAVKALISLGFSPNEASDAINKIGRKENQNTENIIVAALKILAQR